MRSDGKFFSSDFAAGTMIQQIFATESALSRSEVFWFSFRYPKDFFFPPDLSCPVCTPIIRGISLQIHFFVVFFCLFISNGIRRIFFSSDLSCPVCTPIIRGISLQIHFFVVFFLLIYFKWDPKDFFFFRSFGVQICTAPIRRIFSPADPTVFWHLRSDGFWSHPRSERFFTTQFPMDFWLSKSSRLWNPEDLNKIQVGCNAKQWYDPLQQSHEVSKWNSIVCSSKAILWHHGPKFGWMMVLTVSRQDSGHGQPGMKGCKK